MKELCPHLLFVLAAAACVYLPLLAMLIVREGPVSFVLFCFPPITSIPLFALGLGAGERTSGGTGMCRPSCPSAFSSAYTDGSC